MKLLRRIRAWFWRRFHHPDWTHAEPWRKKTYCEQLGHKWGGWRRDKKLPAYTRRCRRRRCPVVEVASERTVVDHGAVYKGGQFWRAK